MLYSYGICHTVILLYVLPILGWYAILRWNGEACCYTPMMCHSATICTMISSSCWLQELYTGAAHSCDKGKNRGILDEELSSKFIIRHLHSDPAQYNKHQL